MSLMSNFKSFLGIKDKATLEASIPVRPVHKGPITEKPVSIIDPRSISVVKSHAIIGAIDRHGSFSRYNRLATWLKDNKAALAQELLNDDEILSNYELALYPIVKGGSLAYGPGCFSTVGPNEAVYTLGDIHGDFESFIAILDTIVDHAKKAGITSPVIYMLGDVIDRETENCSLVIALILAILHRSLPAEFNDWNAIRLGIVKGDHDVALNYDETAKKFTATVSPADYCEWINSQIAAGNIDDMYVGRAWIRLMQECPAAAFLEGSGTFISHGGVPRSDIQDEIKAGAPYVMQNKLMEQDFEWCRMVDAKNKLLNRGTKTSEVGFQEFETFNQLFFNGRIKNFIFGHQHPVTGFQRYNKFFTGYDALCISSFRKDDIVGGPTIPHFCKITPTEINVYSINPAMYVVRLEENSTEAKKPVAP